MIPQSFVAGDDVSFSTTVPAGTDSARVAIQHIDSGKTIIADGLVSGLAASYEFSGQLTADAPPGLYVASQTVVSDDGKRKTTSLGNTRILEPVDRKVEESHARKMVRILEAHIEGRLDEDEGRGIENYTVGGVPIGKIPIATARELLKDYRAQVRAENDARRAALGLATGRRIIRKFV